MLSILNVDLFTLRKYDIEILGQKITVMAIYQKVKQESDSDKIK